MMVAVVIDAGPDRILEALEGRPEQVKSRNVLHLKVKAQNLGLNVKATESRTEFYSLRVSGVLELVKLYLEEEGFEKELEDLRNDPTPFVIPSVFVTLTGHCIDGGYTGVGPIFQSRAQAEEYFSSAEGWTKLGEDEYYDYGREPYSDTPIKPEEFNSQEHEWGMIVEREVL